MQSEITEENIKTLVDTFYTRIRADEKLGPIFERAIGTSADAWKPHLETMYSFWASLMLYRGTYRGNPMLKHLQLPAFDVALFDRWLELFQATVNEIYTESPARQFQIKSQMIAGNLSYVLKEKQKDATADS